MSKDRKDRTPTRPTRPVPRIDLDWPAVARRGDEIQALRLIGDSAFPVSLGELTRRFPDRAAAVARIVSKLQVDGLVEVIEREGVGELVALTTDGRDLLKHL